MHAKTTIVAMTALALLAGCNRGTANNSAKAANTATANTAAAAAPAAAAPAGGAVDQAFLVGHWGQGGSCANTVSFNADGTATASANPEVARYTLAGNVLTVTPPSQAPQPNPVSRSGDNITMGGGPGGQSITLTRCPAPGALPAAATPPAAAADAEEEGGEDSE